MTHRVGNAWTVSSEPRTRTGGSPERLAATMWPRCWQHIAVQSESVIMIVINRLLLLSVTVTIILGLDDVTGNDVTKVNFTSDSSAIRG